VQIVYCTIDYGRVIYRILSCDTSDLRSLVTKQRIATVDCMYCVSIEVTVLYGI
jgi:hypothetical protein